MSPFKITKKATVIKKSGNGKVTASSFAEALLQHKDEEEYKNAPRARSIVKYEEPEEETDGESANSLTKNDVVEDKLEDCEDHDGDQFFEVGSEYET
jgi:hypothetical protein